MTDEESRPCLRKQGDCIEGDKLYIQCRKPGQWKKFRMTEQHQGHKCKAEKNASARILKKYTNIQN